MKINVTPLLIGWVVLILLKAIGILTVHWAIVVVLPPIIFIVGIGIFAAIVLVEPKEK